MVWQLLLALVQAAPVPEPVPAGLVDLAEARYGLVVEKESEKLFLYEAQDGTAPRLVAAWNATTGQAGGDKLAEGDLKTPEGIYFFTETIEDAELPAEYGLRAFVLDYPNAFDRLEGKTGSGIWLHATDQPLKALSTRTTRGCVVVTNLVIEELSDYIELGRTPILIEERVERVSDAERRRERAQLLSFLERWRESWQAWDLAAYLACYAPNFRPGKGTREQWVEHKRRMAEGSGATRVELGRPLILAHRDRAIASFTQRYESSLSRDQGRKTLYLERTGQDYRITAELFRPGALESDPAAPALAGAVASAGLEPVALAPGSAPMPAPTPAQEAAAPTPASTPVAGAQEPLAAGADDLPGAVAPGPPVALAAVETQLEEGRLVVRFRLERLPPGDAAASGRLVVVASAGPDGPSRAYPAVELAAGEPARPGSGEWYSIRRFKIVEAAIERDPGFEPDRVRVFVYDTAGQLRLEGSFAVQSPSRSRNAG